MPHLKKQKKNKQKNDAFKMLISKVAFIAKVARFTNTPISEQVNTIQSNPQNLPRKLESHKKKQERDSTTSISKYKCKKICFVLIWFPRAIEHGLAVFCFILIWFPCTIEHDLDMFCSVLLWFPRARPTENQ